MNKTARVSVLLVAIAIPMSNANAGGLLGDIINIVAPGVGTTLDDAHRKFKDANPKYKAQEEKLTDDVRREIGLKTHQSYRSSSFGRYTIEP